MLRMLGDFESDGDHRLMARSIANIRTKVGATDYPKVI